MKFKTALTQLMGMETKVYRLGDGEGYHSLYSYFAIKAGHAVEGVRTNGHAKRCTIIGAFRHLDREIKEEYESIEQLMRTQKKALIVLNHLSSIIDSFPLCRSCKGDQGTGRNPGEWQDCEECNGYGMIIPLKDQNQEEKWFELVESGLRLRKRSK